MGILVVGSVAFDSVRTPFGVSENALGGSATYFSVAASFFTKVSLVSVVGTDFPDEHIDFFKSRGIDLTGMERSQGKTFRWKGEYTKRLTETLTLETDLNVFEGFTPKLPEIYRHPKIVFLGNIDPTLQQEVLSQVDKQAFVACDTMNFWISGKRNSLLRTLKLVDLLIINDGEARDLSEENNLVKAAETIIKMGPKTLIIKRGEHGVLLFAEDDRFSAPAFPLKSVVDPTGAGDVFAGAFLGHLDKSMNFDKDNIRKAIIFGTVMASFNVEDYSLNRLKQLKYEEIEQRYRDFHKLTQFENI